MATKNRNPNMMTIAEACAAGVAHTAKPKTIKRVYSFTRDRADATENDKAWFGGAREVPVRFNITVVFFHDGSDIELHSGEGYHVD